MSKLTMTIPASEWTEIGDEDNPRSRLLCSIEINGCPMHLEAVEVRAGDARQSGLTEQEHVDTPAWIEEALGASADYDPVMLATIEGRTYALIATPHQQ